MPAVVCVCSPALMYGFSSEHFWRLQGVELAKVPRSNPHPGFGDRLARFPMWCPAVTPLQVTAESQKVKRPPSTAELKGLLIQLNKSEFPGPKRKHLTFLAGGQLLAFCLLVPPHSVGMGFGMTAHPAG